MITQVSIHATLAGGDNIRLFVQLLIRQFLSTPPSRVATGMRDGYSREEGVSIHATLAGGDVKYDLRKAAPSVFLSTPPSRVATYSGIWLV